jgi:hypothetical protein
VSPSQWHRGGGATGTGGGPGEAAKDCWAVVTRLHNVEVDLAVAIGQYHALGIVPLRRRPLRIRELTPNRAPFEGTVTTPEPPSLDEIQHRVALAIGKASYSWPPSRLLPMLPNEGTKKHVSFLPFRLVFRLGWEGCVDCVFSEV